MIFTILQIIIALSIAISLCPAIAFIYYITRYGHFNGRSKMRAVLQTLRGKTFILVPIKVLAWSAVAAWFSIAIPGFDFLSFVLFNASIFHYPDGIFSTWCGTFAGDRANLYVATVFFGSVCGSGVAVAHTLTTALRDTTMAVKGDGTIGNFSEVFDD